MKAVAAVLATIGLVSTLSAHQEQNSPDVPKTKLEAFDAVSGFVIIRGFTAIGKVDGQLQTSVEIESKEFTLAATGKKEYGITIQVKQAARIEREHTSHVDYEEIESLLKGIDYIAKIDATVTKFAGFQADYKTKDDLSISTFSSANGVMVAVTSGRIGAATAYVKLSDLQLLRELIAKAKATIDAVKTVG